MIDYFSVKIVFLSKYLGSSDQTGNIESKFLIGTSSNDLLKIVIIFNQKLAITSHKCTIVIFFNQKLEQITFNYAELYDRVVIKTI